LECDGIQRRFSRDPKVKGNKRKLTCALEKTVAQPSYEQRYCAFIDILGFAELIDNLTQGQTSFQSLQELLTRVHNAPPATAGTDERADFRAQSISDAVAISAAANVKGIASIIHSINRLAVELLAQGFFIRGAIVKDHLYHDDKMVFGNALTQAHRIEASVVRFPRVMVTRSVLQDIAAIDDKNASVLLRRSDDGPMFVHVLRAIEMEMLAVDYGKGKPRLRFDDQKFGGKLDRHVVIAERIQRRFDEATDNPNHFEKAKWFANYWNDTIQEWNIEGFKRITGPGLDWRLATWVD
jgi:hypothetical protein